MGRCRRNLRVAVEGTIDGVAEENGDSWDGCEQKVEKIFMDKLEVDTDIIIEKAHRTKKEIMSRRINHEQ